MVPGPVSPTTSESTPWSIQRSAATSSCQMPTSGSTARSAAAASSRPSRSRRRTPGAPMSRALARSSLLEVDVGQLGPRAASSPTAPVTNGAANDVPEAAT